MILGPGGQLSRALAGPYGELFTGDAAGAGTPVLAIETITAGGEISRLLVPGTEDARIESDPRLFRDPRSDSFVLLWRSRVDEGEDDLDFATWGGAEWSEVFRVEHDGEPASPGAEMLAADTHDQFELEIEGIEPIRAGRMILHLLWQEGDATHYAPLPFVEGRYVGWHGHFVLDESFLQVPEPTAGDGAGGDGDGEGGVPAATEPVELTATLAGTLQLRVAGDGGSVLVTFANPSSHRIGSLEITPLPIALELLGDQVREQIFAHIDLYDPGDLGSFADAMRGAIVVIGQYYDLHEAHAGYVADQVAEWLLTSGGDYGWGGLENLSEDAGDLAVDAGHEVYMSTEADASDPDSEIVRLDVSELFAGRDEAAQVFDFRPRSDLPAPSVGEEGVRVFTSRRGADLLIAWEDSEAGQVHWVESRQSEDGPWSEVFTLALSEELTLEAAHRLLARRIR